MDSPYMYTRSKYNAIPINFNNINHHSNDLKHSINTEGRGVNLLDDVLEKYSSLIGEDKELEELDNYNSENDVNYSLEEFKYIKNLSPNDFNEITHSEKMIKKLGEGKIPLRFKILKSPLSNETKLYIIEKIDNFYAMDEENNEYHKLNSWVKQIEKIPFNQYTPSLFTKEQSTEKLSFCKKCLDESVYGHEEAKQEILRICAKTITNPNSNGNIIGIQGPMGNGKTTLIKNGLAKSLGKKFYFIGMGGATDSGFIGGHSYTWEGSDSGMIVKALQTTKKMDPVIYFDELDKVSATEKGNEIYNILCHITDSSQNTEYQDKYLQNINIDLSRVTFVFSFNDEDKINKILLDRLKIIKTNGFDLSDKCQIAKKHLIPSLCGDIGFKLENIIFSDEVLKYIINNYTSEEGVRGLKKNIETIISNINLLNLLDIDIGINNIGKKINLPLRIDNNIVDKILKKKINNFNSTLYM